VVDLGPEGGEAGGAIVAQGPLDVVMATEASYTGRMLRDLAAGD
jgi:excinuclease ABC subunit A